MTLQIKGRSTYSTDSLTGVVDSGGWSRYFGYDQHGNMWLCGWPGLPPNGSAPAATYCSQNSSSLFNSANQMAGNSYDAAGNLVSVTGSALTYDAENRLTSATQSGIGSMYYSYDGAGRRVQEISTYNTEKVFVYDAFGRLSAEYSVGMPAPPCSTCYIAADHLGSTRLVTDQNGNTVGRHDYVPFGEEIAANSGGRDGTFGTSDFVNQKFTGQERDSETGLDFFQARYFSAALGRFNSPDPGNAGANLFNPQSWNGYTYVTNNPLTLIDPSGTSPFDWFDPSPDDPCADDPFICGYPGFPDFPFPWPSEQPQPQPPPPPPPPAPIVIPHTGGVFAQGQIGSISSSGNLLTNPATVATETLADKIVSFAIRAAIPVFVVEVLLNPSPAGGKSEVEFENANRLREEAARRAKWSCTASCNLQGIGENPPPYPRVTGTGTGSNENEACLNAKRAATQSAPPGTYPRHCQCVCSAQ